MKRYLVFIATVVIVVLVSAVVWIAGVREAVAPSGQVCTMEAKMCPDGSAVGRTGPNCEFAACPAAPVTPAPVSVPPKPAVPAGIAIGTIASVEGVTIGVLELLEDSRCPADVLCVWAGRVRVRASVDSYNRDFTFTLGEPQVVGNSAVTLTSVVPEEKRSQETVPLSDYRFIFTVVPNKVL